MHGKNHDDDGYSDSNSGGGGKNRNGIRMHNATIVWVRDLNMCECWSFI